MEIGEAVVEQLLGNSVVGLGIGFVFVVVGFGLVVEVLVVVDNFCYGEDFGE